MKVTSVVKHVIFQYVLSSKQTPFNTNSLPQLIFQSYAFVMLTGGNSKPLLRYILYSANLETAYTMRCLCKNCNQILMDCKSAF